jgi:hypothetical protein
MAYLNGWSDSTIKKTINKRFTGKAIGGNGVCKYLTDDGKMCGVGIFIPDGHSAQFNTFSINNTVESHKDLIALLPLSEGALYQLQKYHDWDLNFSLATLKKQKALLFKKIKSLAKGQ